MNLADAFFSLFGFKRVPEKRVVKRPRGRIPKGTKAWVLLHPAHWQTAVCECGRWFHEIDHLAPRHTEHNWCKRCHGGEV